MTPLTVYWRVEYLLRELSESPCKICAPNSNTSVPLSFYVSNKLYMDLSIFYDYNSTENHPKISENPRFLLSFPICVWEVERDSLDDTWMSESVEEA